MNAGPFVGAGLSLSTWAMDANGQVNQAFEADLRRVSLERSRKRSTDWVKYKYMQMLLSNNFVRTRKQLAGVLNVSRTNLYNIEALGCLPVSVHEVLDENPALVSGNAIYGIKDLALMHPEIIDTAIRKLAARTLAQNSQNGMMAYIHEEISALAATKQSEHQKEVAKLLQTRYEVEIGSIKMIWTPGWVKLKGELDFDKMAKLIADNLGELKAK